MKYAAIEVYNAKEYENLDKSLIGKSFCVNNEGYKLYFVYYEFDLKDIDKYPGLTVIQRKHDIYRYENGQAELIRHCRHTAEKRYEIQKKIYDRCKNKICRYKEKYKDLTDDIVVNRKINLLDFKRLRYCNNKLSFTLPFALYKPKKIKEKLPLVVYLHGFTNGGESNVIPFTECLLLVLKLKMQMKKYPCMILVPSLPKVNEYVIRKDDNESSLNGFDANFSGILKKLVEKENADERRIYLIGCSNGAAGTWSQLRLHPERYAAAIAMMGWSDDISEEFFESIKNVPVWAVHAEDDPVSIGKFPDSDNYGSDCLVEGLRKAGNSKVRYTRYTKYGHRAAEVFMRKENVVPWLFEQKK